MEGKEEAVSDVDLSLSLIQDARSRSKLLLIAEWIEAAKTEGEDWTENESDMQRLRDAWKIKHKELKWTYKD